MGMFRYMKLVQVTLYYSFQLVTHKQSRSGHLRSNKFLKMKNLREWNFSEAKELLEKIDALKQRLITSFGYDEDSASDVLTYVGSIFARGDVDDDED